jgi:purine-binding chemotaxis protein CheW
MAVISIEKAATYLTFMLGEEVFAIDVQKVREVLDYTSITRVPRTPDFMRGVINLRGSVVPVIDMRLKFGMNATQDTVDTCVIVMEISLDGETTVIGALADSVKEVFDLDPGQIEPPPRIGTRLNTEFIRGMGKYEEQFIIILDIDRVFSADELALVGDAGDNASGTDLRDVPDARAGGSPDEAQ